ncbi:MAG: NAD(P)-binding domain-containing protein [Verrucomicrobiales bacterium]|nr:NAD(P)-binding domain-containing protein [Verrucomicrobiales bacterium]
MSTDSIGFIGAGRITRILLGGFKAAGIALPEVLVSDANAEALARLKSAFPEITAIGTDNTQPARQGLVILAVHPPAIPVALAGLAPSLRRDSTVLSLAPKFTLAKLAELLSGHPRVVRMIPNAPSVIGAGFNPIAFANGIDGNQRAGLRDFLSPLGECPEVEEQKLEGYALLSAMGPTYLWFQLQALRELALEFGLSDSETGPALKRTVCGAMRTLLESGLSPSEVMDLIPVKPLAEDEAAIRQAYLTRLPALFAKIKP